jgi:hypothetical protein
MPLCRSVYVKVNGYLFEKNRSLYGSHNVSIINFWINHDLSPQIEKRFQNGHISLNNAVFKQHIDILLWLVTLVWKLMS